MSLRSAGIVLLVCALLAPKLALAVSMLGGDGYRSVVICTGSQLVRVMVSPEGEIVDDTDAPWVGPHCVITDHDVVVLERAWALAGWPRSFLVGAEPAEPAIPLPRALRPACCSRAPPAQA